MAETTLPSFAPGTLDARIDDPALAAAVAAALARADEERWGERLHDRDTTLWSTDPAVQEPIAQPPRLARPARRLQRPGPGPRGLRRGDPRRRLHRGDRRRDGRQQPRPRGHRDRLRRRRGLAARSASSTRPIPPPSARPGTASTRWRPSSSSARKSGTTTETLAFQADAWERIHDALRSHGARTRVARRVHGRHHRSRQVTRGDPPPGRAAGRLPQPGGRRRALLGPQLRRARARIAGRHRPRPVPGLRGRACSPAAWPATRRPTRASPWARCSGALAAAGRDKLTLVVDPAIGPLGAWLEQLIAESTGKLGPGSCRSTGSRSAPRPPTAPTASSSGSPSRARPRRRRPRRQPRRRAPRRARAAGHPVLRFALADPIDLAGEFVRWEVATAIAGIVLGINPFDEPNVTESKENTRRVLEELEHPAPPPRGCRWPRASGLALHGDTALRLTAGDGTLVGELRRHLARLRPSGYLAIGAFVAPTAGRGRGARPDPGPPPRRDRARDDRRLRAALPPLDRPAAQGRPGDRLVPPAHRDHPADLPVPGRPYTFGQLIDAQAAATWRRSRRTTCRSSGSTSAPTSTPGSPRWRPPSPRPCVGNHAPFAGADAPARHEQRGL